MLYLVVCAQCGHNPCPEKIGQVSVTLKLTGLRKICEKCHHWENCEHSISFCSAECLAKFMSEGKLEREIGITAGIINPWMGE